MRNNIKPRTTTLRAKIKVRATNKLLTGTPQGFGIQASDGNFYNRSEYTVLKRYEEKANAASK